MSKKELIFSVDYIESTFSLDELCEICEVTPGFIEDLIAYEIIYPANRSEGEWIFDMVQLQRLKTALRLQRDLEMNFAGVAVVLDLLDEIDQLRAKADLLEKYILK